MKCNPKMRKYLIIERFAEKAKIGKKIATKWAPLVSGDKMSICKSKILINWGFSFLLFLKKINPQIKNPIKTENQIEKWIVELNSGKLLFKKPIKLWFL